jgi:hypothetical protein
VRDIWFDWLRERRPDLLPRYKELYERGAYMRKDEASRLSAMVRRPGRNGARRGIEQPPKGETGHERAGERPGQSSLF